MKKYLQNPWARLAGAIFLVGCLYIVVRQLEVDFSTFTIESFKGQVRSWGAWGPVLYIILYIIRPLVLFPAGIFSAVGGAIWGMEALSYILIAATFSSLIEFYLARYGAREIVMRAFHGKMPGLDNAIEKRGFLTVFLIRVVPNVAWDIQNLCLGLTKVKFRDYFWATLLGILPATFAYCYFGASLIAILSNPYAFIVVCIVLLMALGIYFLQRFLKQKYGNFLKP